MSYGYTEHIPPSLKQESQSLYMRDPLDTNSYRGITPLLRQLQSQSVGISVNSTYAREYLYADDIRTLTSSPTTLETQISLVTVHQR